MINASLKNKWSIFLTLSVIVFLSLLITSVGTIHILDVSAQDMLREYVFKGYLFHYNISVAPAIKSFSFNVYLYITFLVSLSLYSVYRLLIHRQMRKPQLIADNKFIFYMSLYLLGVALVIQTLSFARIHGNEYTKFSGKEFHERILNLDRGYVFKFSSFCHRHIAGHKQAKLVTDLDISKSYGMSIHRMIAYYLYPIDIREVRPGQPEYLLLFMKKDARQHVPKNFKVIATINKNNLIAQKVF